MAAYPSIKQNYGSVKESSRNTQTDVAVSGAVRLRTLYSQAWAVFTVLHTCSAAQKDEILAHYAAHASSSFTFTFIADGQQYTVRYANMPQASIIDLSGDWEVRSTLVQV